MVKEDLFLQIIVKQSVFNSLNNCLSLRISSAWNNMSTYFMNLRFGVAAFFCIQVFNSFI